MLPAAPSSPAPLLASSAWLERSGGVACLRYDSLGRILRRLAQLRRSPRVFENRLLHPDLQPPVSKTVLPDKHKVAILSGLGPITGALGNIIGGLVADFLARLFHLHGRPLSAQLTVAFGIPLIYVMFQGIPPGQGSFEAYLALNIAFGLLGSWAQSGTNFPILSHIVPADARSRVMAWECALENSLANAIGPMVVGLLAEKAFGYTFGSHEGGSGEDLASADALGKALAATICIPWIVCFFAYSLLHWSYPRDVRRLEAGMAATSSGDFLCKASAEAVMDQVVSDGMNRQESE